MDYFDVVDVLLRIGIISSMFSLLVFFLYELSLLKARRIIEKLPPPIKIRIMKNAEIRDRSSIELPSTIRIAIPVWEMQSLSFKSGKKPFASYTAEKDAVYIDYWLERDGWAIYRAGRLFEIDWPDGFETADIKRDEEIITYTAKFSPRWFAFGAPIDYPGLM